MAAVLDTPILLRATSLSVAVGSITGFDPSLLQNPYRRPMLLREVRFTVRDLSDDNVSQAGNAYAELRMGRIPLTHGFVPIRLLCRAYDMRIEADTGGDVTHIWRFPKPLYVPATEYVDTRIQSQSFASGSMDFHVTYVGTMLGDGHARPATIDVPWATAFVGARQAGGSDFFEQSGEQDLSNPFETPLYVQRFLGSVPLTHATTAVDITLGEPTVGIRRVFVQVVDHDGQIVCRDRTRFWSLFSPTDRAWNAKCVLPPRGHFVFMFDEVYTSETATLQLGVSMLGHRKVILDRGYVR